jgi:hypothetical protein
VVVNPVKLTNSGLKFLYVLSLRVVEFNRNMPEWLHEYIQSSGHTGWCCVRRVTRCAGTGLCVLLSANRELFLRNRTQDRQCTVM